MHVESMKDFLVFSRYMNVSRAAKMLNVSQPTLSYRISKLESELGFDLTDHAPRPRLTAAGKLFVRYAESICNQYDDMLETCLSTARADSGTLVFERPITFVQVEKEIETMCAEFEARENVGVRFVKSHTTLFDALESGQVDIGFIWSFPEFVEEETGDIAYIRVPGFEHPTVNFYMKATNPLATKSELTPQDLDGAKIVFPLSIRYAIFDEVMTLGMRREGIGMRVVHKAGTYGDIELGLENDEIAFRMYDLGDPERIERELGIVSRKSAGDAWIAEPYFVYFVENDNPALEEFLRFVESPA